MTPIFDRFLLLAAKMERYVSLAAVFSLAIFLVRIASPDVDGGTGR